LEDHGEGRRREESLRSRSGCAPRRLAPRTWPASLAAASAGEVIVACHRHPLERTGRIGPTSERGDTRQY